MIQRSIFAGRPNVSEALLLRGKFEFNDGKTSYTRGAKRMLAAPLKTGGVSVAAPCTAHDAGSLLPEKKPRAHFGGQRIDNLFYHNHRLSSHLGFLCPFYVCSLWVGVHHRCCSGIMVQSVSRSPCLVRLAHITAAGTLCFARYRCAGSACTVWRSRQDAAAPVLLLVQGNQPPFCIPAANQGSVSGDAALLTSAPF